jgi:hypothetical protein
MSTESIEPVIFISYSHKDEPAHPGPDDVQWLSFVLSQWFSAAAWLGRLELNPIIDKGDELTIVDARMRVTNRSLSS